MAYKVGRTHCMHTLVWDFSAKPEECSETHPALNMVADFLKY